MILIYVGDFVFANWSNAPLQKTDILLLQGFHIFLPRNEKGREKKRKKEKEKKERKKKKRKRERKKRKIKKERKKKKKKKGQWWDKKK